MELLTTVPSVSLIGEPARTSVSRKPSLGRRSSRIGVRDACSATRSRPHPQFTSRRVRGPAARLEGDPCRRPAGRINVSSLSRPGDWALTVSPLGARRSGATIECDAFIAMAYCLLMCLRSTFVQSGCARQVHGRHALNSEQIAGSRGYSATECGGVQVQRLVAFRFTVSCQRNQRWESDQAD